MTYVMANPHGDLSGYRELTGRIRLSAEDILYVLGDITDYGEDGVELLTELSMCENVFPVAGEHDFKALRMLSGFDRMLRDGTMPDPSFISEMTEWASQGGQVTLDGFRKLDTDMREGVLDYLSEFPLYEEIEVGGKRYVLVHAGIAGYQPGMSLDSLKPQDFFTPLEGELDLPEQAILVVGHEPTKSGCIERTDRTVWLDCGAGRGGRLGCLCLDTGDTFYAGDR